VPDQWLDDAKVQKMVEIAKEKCKYFGILLNNVE